MILPPKPDPKNPAHSRFLYTKDGQVKVSALLDGCIQRQIIGHKKVRLWYIGKKRYQVREEDYNTLQRDFCAVFSNIVEARAAFNERVEALRIQLLLGEIS